MAFEVHCNSLEDVATFGVMSNRKIGWAFTTERPVAVQSPSLMPLSDVQTRLDFRYVEDNQSPIAVSSQPPITVQLSLPLLLQEG